MTSVRINNSSVRIPLLGETGLGHILSTSEAWMNTLLKRVFDKFIAGKMFVDVGVNIGQTLLKIKSIDKEVAFSGFEPNPECVRYLEHLIRANNLAKTTIFPVAVGEVTNIRNLMRFSEEQTDASASLVEDFRPSNTVVDSRPVPVFSFRDMESGMGIKEEIGLVKIDVEGAESEVLKGFYHVMSQQRPLVLIEILPVYVAANTFRAERQEMIRDACVDLAYSIFRINKTADELSSISQIDQFGVHADLAACDYILCPTEQARELVKIVNAAEND